MTRPMKLVVDDHCFDAGTICLLQYTEHLSVDPSSRHPEFGGGSADGIS